MSKRIKEKVEAFAKLFGFTDIKEWKYTPVNTFRKPVFDLLKDNLKVQIDTEFNYATFFVGEETEEVVALNDDWLNRLEDAINKYYGKQNEETTNQYLVLM